MVPGMLHQVPLGKVLQYPKHGSIFTTKSWVTVFFIFYIFLRIKFFPDFRFHIKAFSQPTSQATSMDVKGSKYMTSSTN